jgi:uncharacterized protein YggE
MHPIAKSTPALNFGKLWQTLPAALLLCMSFTQPSLAEEKERMYRTLTVSGRGVESIATTLSQVNVGVEVQGKSVQEVQQEAARKSSAVVTLLKSRNVEKLQTTGINLNPIYNYTNNTQKITGYSATNTVSFRISTDKTGNLLDDIVKAGATRIDGISFVASDDAIAGAQKQALRKATQEAQQQADAVFGTLGLKSKEVVSIQINNATTPPPVYRAFENRSAKMADAASVSTPVVGGEQQVEASVTLQISY